MHGLALPRCECRAQHPILDPMVASTCTEQRRWINTCVAVSPGVRPALLNKEANRPRVPRQDLARISQTCQGRASVSHTRTTVPRQILSQRLQRGPATWRVASGAGALSPSPDASCVGGFHPQSHPSGPHFSRGCSVGGVQHFCPCTR